MKKQLGLYTASFLLLAVAGCGVSSVNHVNQIHQPVKVKRNVQGAGFSLGNGSWWENDYLPAPHWPYPQVKAKKPVVQPTTKKKPSSSPASKTPPKPVTTKPKTINKTVPSKPKTPPKTNSGNPLANVRLGQELPTNFNMPGASWYGQEEANWFEAQGGRIFVIKAFHTPNGNNYYIAIGSAFVVNKHIYKSESQVAAVLGQQDWLVVRKSMAGY